MLDKYQAQEQEELIKKFWLEKKIFAFDKLGAKPTFSIDTPPPTVSGSLHIGHVFSYLHTDIIARYKRLAGFNVYYPMGFDDNGLPTEKFVEKKQKIRSADIKRSAFISLCQQECSIAEEGFKELWQAIGLSVDWNYCYTTISELSRKVSQSNFLSMLRQGLVYRKKEPSLFCTEFQTTVAQAELATVQKESSMNTLAFHLENDEQTIQIATTRPELLPACVAIFVHPCDIRYRNFIGKKAIVPLFGQKVRIVSDEDVLADKGTGAVMCCTFGDQQDVAWFRRYNLSYIEAIGKNGCMTANAGFLQGLKIAQARQTIIETLRSKGYLRKEEPIKHDVHIYERSKKEIEYIIFPQWFVKVLDFKELLLSAGDQINWHPNFMKTRYQDWVKNLTWDWCISRQRYMGIPFPVWHCLDCNATLVAEEKALPVDPSEMPYPKGKCDQCGKANIAPDTDIMDTWATSSSTPQINAEMLQSFANDFLPMSMRPQAHDIIRTWAFYTIVKSAHLQAKLPWKNLVISGHVLSPDNEKISKSANNSQVAPQALLAQFPADAIRFWAAKGRLGFDTPFSQEQIKNGNRLITKLWNALRFVKISLTSAKEIDPELNYKKEPATFDALSSWLFVQLEQTNELYHKYFEAYEYSLALEAVDAFFWHTFCDNYLEIVKDQIFNPQNYPPITMQNYAYALYNVGLAIIKLYAPFLPFVTEAIYQAVFSKTEKEPSVHNTVFTTAPLAKADCKNIAKDFSILIEVLAAVRKLKSANSLSLKTESIQLVLAAANLDLFRSDPVCVQLLLGVTKCKTLLLMPNGHFESALEETDAGLVTKINLFKK